MIRDFPKVLSYNFSRNVEPTLSFLMEQTAVTRAEVVSNVRLLSFSLTKRIQPRYHFALQHGLVLTPLMIQQSDRQFIEQNFKNAKVDIAQYEQFKEDYLASLEKTKEDLGPGNLPGLDKKQGGQGPAKSETKSR
eukprot:g56660.t1